MKATQKKSPIRYVALALSTILMISIVLEVARPSIASAAAFSDLSIEEKAQVWVMGRAVSKCINNKGFNTGNKSASDINKGQWMYSNDTGIDGSTDIGEWSADITEGKSDDSRENCATAAKKTLELMGTSGIEAICRMNELTLIAGTEASAEVWKRDSGDCRNGTGDYDFQEDSLWVGGSKNTEIWNRFFREWLGGDIEASLTRGMRYLIYSENFYQECSKDHGAAWNTPREWKSGDKEDNKTYKLKWNKKGTTPDKDWYVVSGGNGRGKEVNIDGYTMLASNDKLQCKTLAERINDNASAYLEEVAKSTNPQDAVDATDSTDDPSETETACAVDGMGWIICPAMNFMARINDAALGFLGDNFLNISPNFFQEGADAEGAWKGFRDIANILFVLLFLFIIYSQMTGAGISNYGIKRMLPKLIIAAILVNASFILCRIAIDLSNIIGANISQFFATQLPTGVSDNGPTYDPDTSWTNSTTAILAGGAVLGLALLFVVGLPVLLVLAMIVLILIARKAIIILLVVTAPVVFVAYLLPNTEGIFKKWWGLFKAMLFLYPIIGMVFGASVLAAKIIGSSATAPGISGIEQTVLQITALAVTALPLFAVPLLLKGALGGLGSIGAKLSGGLDRANRAATSNIKKGRSGEAIAAFKRRKDERRVKRRVGKGVMGRINRKIDGSRVGRIIGGDRGAAAAVAEQHKMTNEQVEQSAALLQHGDAAGLVERAHAQLIEANARGDVIAARAATRVLASQTGSRGIDKLHEAIAEIERSPGGLHRNVGDDIKHDITSAGLKGKDRSLDLWSRDERADPTRGGITTLAGYDAHTTTTHGLNEAELAGHSTAQLRRFGETAGGIDAGLAQRVMDAHDAGTIHLDPDKREILKHAVAGRTYTPAPTGSPPGTAGTWA